ncbi:Variable outer membrane protein (plasmid) [Borrelia hermsii YBT]|uniref:Variable large protein n=1 Tax=Borrelia hermsii YBT TaxID=1313295 RepID=W5T0W0_BORHE|nr:Variable outer membrane protein [Borrelia hermsii YBT]
MLSLMRLKMLRIGTAKDVASIAIAKKEDKNDHLDAVAKKDAVIAAGITLRAMAKGGKFAVKNEDKSAHAVNGEAASAVGKTLSTLIIAIRNTVDSGLRTINEALATVKQEDKSAKLLYLQIQQLVYNSKELVKGKYK